MKQLRNLTLELSTKAPHDPFPEAVERLRQPLSATGEPDAAPPSTPTPAPSLSP